MEGNDSAMHRRPSLISFVGPCIVERSAPVPVREEAEEDLDAVEPEPARPKPDEVHLDDERAAPVAVEAFMMEIVASAAETMAMLAEHRVSRPFSHRPTREGRILNLLDAILATGDKAIVDVLGWCARAREDCNQWALWPAVFVLGLVEGPAGILGVGRLLEALPADDGEAVLVAANALVATPHPGVVALAEDLIEGGHPVAGAVGIEVLSRRGVLDVDRAAELLGSGAPPLVAAAIRALVRADRATERVGSLLSHDDLGVVWEAARAVTLWGDSVAMRAVRERGEVAVRLGARAAELLVMAGDADDIAHLEAIAASAPVTPELLDAIGRFGNPLAWSFLLHYLADPDLSDAAEGALSTLFGAAVEAAAVRQPAAWRDALAERDMDPALRYRAGVLWTPGAVADELRAACVLGGALFQLGIEHRLDELEARTGLAMGVEMASWALDAEAKLRQVSESAMSMRWRAGSWSGPRVGKTERGSR